MLGRKLSSNGTLIAAIAAVALVGGCDRASTGPSDSEGNFFAAHLIVQSGDNQSGPSNAALAAPVAVKVTDAGGQAVAGAKVQFIVRVGGGTVSSITSASDTSGVASSVWTLGASLGPQKLVAILNTGIDSVAFSAVATSGSPAHILLVSGNGQVGRSNQALAAPLVVEVTDASGKTLAGASVTFTQGTTNPDAFTSSNPVTTGADGTASVTWTLGQNTTNTTVPMTVVASITGSPTSAVTFSATARPEYRIRREITPFLQSDTTGATLGSPGDYLAGSRDTLRVQVFDPTDSSGVQGVVITWAPLTPGDGHLINATSVTDNKGIAKTLWVLLADTSAIVPTNLAHRVTATASMGQVEFQARVTPGRMCSVAQEVSGATSVNTPVNLTATVRDCNGFPVPGATVTFAPTSGSVAPVTTFSDASGRAFTTWTLGGSIGVQKMNAVASGQADPYVGAAYPTFGASSVLSVTATPVPPASITATNPPSSPSPVNSVHNVIFHVTDANGVALANQLVTFAVSAGGGTVAPGSGVTDASGNVTATWTLGGTAATVNTMTATAGSVTTTVNCSTP